MTKSKTAGAAERQDEEILTAPIYKPSKALAFGNHNPAQAVPGRAIPEAVHLGAYTLGALPQHGCKWPMAVDGEGERTFCGSQRAEGDRRYCSVHAKKAGASPAYIAQDRADTARLIKHLGRKGAL